MKFLRIILDDSIWSRTFESKRKESLLQDPRQTSNDSLNKDSSDAQANQTVDAVKNEHSKMVTVIDYEATYQEIELCVHQVEILSASLRLERRVYQSQASRCSFLMHILRINLFQCLVVACQYANSLVLASLLAVETAKVATTVLLYIKLRHLKNLLLLVMEVLNSLFLGVFMLICLWVNLSEHTAGDAYQTAAIYTIITSCVCEYLLLISYIAITVFNAVKNRKKANKQSGAKKTALSFIKYSVIASVQTPEKLANGPEFWNSESKESPVGSQRKHRFLKPNKVTSFFSGILNNRASDRSKVKTAAERLPRETHSPHSRGIKKALQVRPVNLLRQPKKKANQREDFSVERVHVAGITANRPSK